MHRLFSWEKQTESTKRYFFLDWNNVSLVRAFYVNAHKCLEIIGLARTVLASESLLVTLNQAKKDLARSN